MYTISKAFTFEASHALDAMPDGHKCKRLHGHSYAVEVILAADALDRYGFVLDYGDLGAVKDWIDATLDHRHLGGAGIAGALDHAVSGYVDLAPTAENIAMVLYHRFRDDYPELVAVRVSETRKTWASYSEEPLRWAY